MDPHSTRNATSFITFQTGLTTDNYCSISALALLVYEYIILLDKEVDLFWNRKVAGASALFLLNRYLPIVAYIIRPSTMIQMSCLSNSIMQLMSQTLAFLQYIPWAAFSALRAFALCEPPYNWPIAALVFMLSSVSIVTNFTRFYWIVPVPANPVFGGSDCILYEVHPPVYIEVYFSLAARACLIAADFIVLCVTWRATSYKFPRLVRNSIRGVGTKKDTFANIIFRDGVIYFIVLLIMNVIYLTLTIFPAQVDPLTQVSYVVEFYEPLTAVLTSRFLLDLHEVNRQLGNSQSAAAALSSAPLGHSVVFADRAVGSGWSFDSSFSTAQEDVGTTTGSTQL